MLSWICRRRSTLPRSLLHNQRAGSFSPLRGQQTKWEQLDSRATLYCGPRHAEVTLAPGALRGMEASRALIDRIATSDGVVDGVNTGFGKMATVRVSSSELCALQTNLVRSHACGVGSPLGEPGTRAMILLCGNALTRGYRGVHDRERLCDRNRPRSGGHRRFRQFDWGWLRDVRYREL